VKRNGRNGKRKNGKVEAGFEFKNPKTRDGLLVCPVCYKAIGAQEHPVRVVVIKNGPYGEGIFLAHNHHKGGNAAAAVAVRERREAPEIARQLASAI